MDQQHVKAATMTATRNEPMFISVVVCTHNRLESLTAALISLCQLQVADFIDWELLVIDNDSPPGVEPIVSMLRDKYPGRTIRYVREPRRGIAHARQRGVEEARGPWIAFFDDDQLAHPSWLTELAHAARTRRSLCVGGQVKLKLPDDQPRELGPLCRDLLSETVNQPAPRRYDRRFKPGAGNLMIHRLALERVGGFDQLAEGRGEDTILFLKILRAGYECWYTPAALIYHVIPASRLTPQTFDALTKYVGARMPLFEKDYWRWMFPLAWLARLAQVACVLTPEYLVCRFSRVPEVRLESRCKLFLAIQRLRHGVRLLGRPSGALVSTLPEEHDADFGLQSSP